MAGIQNTPLFLFSQSDEVLINIDQVTSIKRQGNNPMFNFNAPSESVTVTGITWDDFVANIINPSLSSSILSRYPNNKSIVLLDP